MSSQAKLDDYSLDLLLHAARSFEWEKSGELSDSVTRFLKQVHSALDPTSLDLFRLDDIAAMSKAYWDWTADRPQKKLLRVRQAEDRNGQTLRYKVLELCLPDMPLLCVP